MAEIMSPNNVPNKFAAPPRNCSSTRFIRWPTLASGLEASTSTELRQLADEIGFPDVLAAGLDQQELRRIFNLVSVSTVSMSQQGAMPAGMFS